MVRGTKISWNEVLYVTPSDWWKSKNLFFTSKGHKIDANVNKTATFSPKLDFLFIWVSFRSASRRLFLWILWFLVFLEILLLKNKQRTVLWILVALLNVGFFDGFFRNSEGRSVKMVVEWTFSIFKLKGGGHLSCFTSNTRKSVSNNKSKLRIENLPSQNRQQNVDRYTNINFKNSSCKTLLSGH